MRACFLLLLWSLLASSCAPGADIFVGTVGTDAGPLDRDASPKDAAKDACVAESDCPRGLHCNLRSNLCVECVTRKHCPQERPLCIDVDHVCGQCDSAADCPLDRSRCTKGTHECVQCESELDCPVERPLCLLERGRCVLCRSDEDCPSGEICEIREYHCELPGR